MTDRELIAYVNNAINAGAKEITVPARLLENASREAIAEVRSLCELNGVKIVAVEA